MANTGRQAGPGIRSNSNEYYAACNGIENSTFVPRTVPDRATYLQNNTARGYGQQAHGYGNQQSYQTQESYGVQQGYTHGNRTSDRYNQLPKESTDEYLDKYYNFYYGGIYYRKGHTYKSGGVSYPINEAMAYNQYGNSQQYSNPGYSYGYTPGYNTTYAQQQPYQNTPPVIQNPFAPPTASNIQGAGQDAIQEESYEDQVRKWQSAYQPQDQQDQAKKGGKHFQGEYSNQNGAGARPGTAQAGVESTEATQDGKKMTVMRKGGGETWEDPTLLQWDPSKFRIQVGNLAGEVTDDSLAKAFEKYGGVKAFVVRDKRTTKSKGYGFVQFDDANLGFQGAKEMQGKYVASHPVTIQRAKTDVRGVEKKNKKQGKYDKKQQQKKDGGDGKADPLRAHTGATIVKKPVKNAQGYKILG